MYSEGMVASGPKSSTDTALCLIPPADHQYKIDQLRSLYDKAYGNWPPHINLIYPFVEFNSLHETLNRLVELDLNLSSGHQHIELTEVGLFYHKKHTTLHIKPSDESIEWMRSVRRSLMTRLGRGHDGNYNPHMTIGQVANTDSDGGHFLAEKAGCLTPILWQWDRLAVLIRDKSRGESATSASRMKLWGYYDLEKSVLDILPEPCSFYDQSISGRTRTTTSETRNTYHFCERTGIWKALEPSEDPPSSPERLERLIVASYNVLGDIKWPPGTGRSDAIITTILSSRATSDIIVLQEVTDHFLTILLTSGMIRSAYPYASHGPPAQSGIGSLPNLLNIVILSHIPFEWRQVPFHIKHEAAAVATFPTLLCSANGRKPLPLVLAGCHFTPGLVDHAINAKKLEFKRLFECLSSEYTHHPWVIAGDLNITSSHYSLHEALAQDRIALNSYKYLRDFDDMLSVLGIQDAWLASRIRSGDSFNHDAQHLSSELYGGEQGATFSPFNNYLATSRADTEVDCRPQRYDRILINENMCLRPSRFNIFGLPLGTSNDKSCHTVASDQWGVRCLLQPLENAAMRDTNAWQRSLTLHKASPMLDDSEEIRLCLDRQGMIPGKEEMQNRHEAITILREALQCRLDVSSGSSYCTGPRLILEPVGSFALGVWTSLSDIDCICIGDISQKTFFSLAKSRLRRFDSGQTTVLRTVRASSGTMLKLDIEGIRFNIHYCCSVSVLEGFPRIMNRPTSDPAFALPLQTLSKLKPLRDCSYLIRSIPDLAQYRNAHRLIKAWAQDRGLYGARFGLLGSIQISALLVPVCKALANAHGIPSIADLVVTFFDYYATFDWKSQIAFDEFFHGPLKYHRSFREPLCLLGWHSPSLNTALNASLSSVRTLSTEIRRARNILCARAPTWTRFLGTSHEVTRGKQGLSSGALDFLDAHELFAKINLQYWGSSSGGRAGFVGRLESRCVSLLIDLDWRLPALETRLWPQRFTHIAAHDDGNLSKEYQGFYLIGLSWQDDNDLFGPRDGTIRTAEDLLVDSFHQFESRLRDDNKYFDATTCWLGAEVVCRGDIGTFVFDAEEIGTRVGFDDDSSTDGDMSNDDDDEEPELGSVNPRIAHEAQPEPPILLSNGQLLGSRPKLRTSRDVMDRLRWDPRLDPRDYVVGYEDRFDGTQEKLLEQWKTEQTDEEFIPQHRISYFKRRSDGILIWDRRTRVDNLFSSGIVRHSLNT